MGSLKREKGGWGGVGVPGMRKPARIAPGGRSRRCRSVAVGPAAARPDQAEGLATFVIEKVGVDRRGEARIVELNRAVIAALARALRRGRTDLGTAARDPVGWRAVAGPVGLRSGGGAFGLAAEADDLGRDLVPGLREGTEGWRVRSPWLGEPASIPAWMRCARPQAT